MRKTSFVIAILLCCGHLWAGLIPSDLPGLRAYTRMQLRGAAKATTLHSDSAVMFALNRGAAATCEDFLCLEKVATITVTKSDTSGALPTDCIEVRQVFQIAGDTLWLPILHRSPDSLPASNGTVDRATQKGRGLGSFEYFHTWATRLIPFQKSKSTMRDSFIVYYYSYDSQLVDSTDSLHLAAKYLEKVIWYACMCLSFTDGDLERAASYRAEYERGMPPKPFKGNTVDK